MELCRVLSAEFFQTDHRWYQHAAGFSDVLIAEASIVRVILSSWTTRSKVDDGDGDIGKEGERGARL